MESSELRNADQLETHLVPYSWSCSQGHRYDDIGGKKFSTETSALSLPVCITDLHIASAPNACLTYVSRLSAGISPPNNDQPAIIGPPRGVTDRFPSIFSCFVAVNGRPLPQQACLWSNRPARLVFLEAEPSIESGRACQDRASSMRTTVSPMRPAPVVTMLEQSATTADNSSWIYRDALQGRECPRCFVRVEMIK